MTDAPHTAPPPSPPGGRPPGGRPPLQRPAEGRILAGVAAGIADHLDVDVAIVRVLIVVLAVLTNGLAVLVYLVAIFVVPEAEPGQPSAAVAPSSRSTSGDRDPLFWVGITVTVLGVLWLLSSGRGVFSVGAGFFPYWSAQLLWPLVLIAFGVALWRSGDRRSDGGTAGVPTSPPAPPPVGADVPASPMGAHAVAWATTRDARPTTPPEAPMTTPTDTDPGATLRSDPDPDPGVAVGAAAPVGPPPPPTSQDPQEPSWTPPPPPAPRERSMLTRLTLGIALVVTGVLWSLRLADVLVLGPGQILASALLVIGVGLLVGTVAGRGRWLLLVGALLVPLVLLSAVARPLGLDDWRVVGEDGARVGDLTERVVEVDRLQDSYQFAAGTVLLDLSELELDGRDLTTSVQLGAGELVVVVPEGMGLEVNATTGVGEIDLGPTVSTRTGLGLRASLSQAAAPELPGTLDLSLSSGVGTIELRTVSVAVPEHPLTGPTG